MFCTNCGTQVKEGAKFCGSCGAKIEAAQETVPSAADNPTPSGALGGVMPDQMKANAMEGLADTARQEMAASYRSETPVQEVLQSPYIGAPSVAQLQSAQPVAVVASRQTKKLPLPVLIIAGAVLIAGIAALWFVRVDDVYVAGSITEGDTQKAVYWKNGKVFPLPVEAQRSSAQSIYVSGKDAIVAGIEFENIPGYESELPFGKYWKNGVKHGLKFSDGYGYLMENAALCVSGGNVYQTGWADGTNGPIAYSKNGEVTAYVTASIGSVHSIAVEGADIYLAGFIDRSAVNNWLNDKDTGSQSSNIEPLYWKNGDDVVFLSPGKLGMVNAIQVSNSDVYTAGFIMVDGEAKATYWKNDNETVLSSDGQSISSGQSLFVAGQDIYVAGQRSAGENKEAVYWKNNQATVLGNGSSAVAASIFVLDSDVYVCGSTSNQSTGIMIACYWKNGKIKYLDNGASASADAIFVVNKPLWERLLGK